MAPKVSEDYLEARREQILDAARTCFMQKGYHRATMQDICKAAELSPGAVYRYFDSKESIFEGLAERHLLAQTEALGCLEGMDDLFASVATFATQMIALAKAGGATRPGMVQVELAGEAMSNERMAAIVRRMLDGVRQNLGQLVVKLQAQGRIDAALDHRAVASVLMSIFQGGLFQQAMDPRFDLEAYLSVVRSLSLPVGEATEDTA